MKVYFEFKHHNLSLIELHNLGIRNVKEVEETILGDSFWEEVFWEDQVHILIATGFSKSVTGMVVAFTIDENLVITTLQVKRATVEEIKKDFCKYCK